MNNPLGFFTDLLRQPAWVVIWVVYLMAINLGSVVFWQEPLAKLVLVTFLVSATFMMALYARFGFEKVLGLGHILWVPLLAYLLVQVPAMEGAFQTYLVVLALSIAVSLVFDIYDVWVYFSRAAST